MTGPRRQGMRRFRWLFAIGAATMLVAAAVAAQTGAKPIDITGQWTASFDTQIGHQDYTYDFVVKDGKLTGKAKSSLADAAVDVQDGTVEADTVKFIENL